MAAALVPVQPRHHHSPDTDGEPRHLGRGGVAVNDRRLLMNAIGVVCGLGCASSLWPPLDGVLATLTVVGGAATAGTALVRRELRIRRRLCDVDGLRFAVRAMPGSAGSGEEAA